MMNVTRLTRITIAAALAAAALVADAGGGPRYPTDRSPDPELGQRIAQQGNAALREIRAEARRSAQALQPAPLHELTGRTLLARAER